MVLGLGLGFVWVARTPGTNLTDRISIFGRVGKLLVVLKSHLNNKGKEAVRRDSEEANFSINTFLKLIF